MIRKMLLLGLLCACVIVFARHDVSAQCGPGGGKSGMMDTFLPGSTTAYGWLAPDEGLEQMKATKKPGLLYFYSMDPRATRIAKDIECKLFAAHRFKYVGDKFVTMKCDSTLKHKVGDIKLPKGGVGMMFLGCDGKKIGSMMKRAPSPTSFDKSAKKAMKENCKRAEELACGCE